MTILFMFLMTLGAFAQDEAGAEEAPAADAPAEEVEAPAAEEGGDDAEAPAAEEGGEEGEAEAGEEAEAEEAAEEVKEDVPAVEVPQSDEEAIADVKESVEALKNGQWATFVVLLLGLLAFGWNRFRGLKAGSKDDAKSE
jgi:hypothetical protein